MRNLGMGELLLVLVVGLLVFGPRRLPEIARNLGKAWRVFQDETRKAREVLKESLDEETRMVSDVMTEAGVVDHPDGAPKPKPRARKVPSAREIEQAAAIEPARDRVLEDT
jgi:TatA/E family protein of Tat protein translocase